MCACVRVYVCVCGVRFGLCGEGQRLFLKPFQKGKIRLKQNKMSGSSIEQEFVCLVLRCRSLTRSLALFATAYPLCIMLGLLYICGKRKER